MISLTSQLSALRHLKSVDQNLKILDKRVNTGINVADARDSTSLVAAARASGSASVALSSVQSSLNLGIATVSTASSAITNVSSFLGNVRNLLEAAKDGNADLASIQAQLSDQQMRLRSAISGAAFKNVNLLASSTSISSYVGAPKSSAGTAYAISVDRNRTRLLDTLGTTGILQKTFDLTAVSTATPPSTLGLSGSGTQTSGTVSSTPPTNGLAGTASSVAGQAANAVAPATSGLDGAGGAVAGTAAATPSTAGLSGAATLVTGNGTSSPAKITVDVSDPTTTFRTGDTAELLVTLNGVTRTVLAYTRSMSTVAASKTELQRALDASFGSNVLIADFATNAKFTITAAATGANQDLSLSGFRIIDGDDVLTSKLGMAADNNFNYVNNSTVDGQSRSSQKYNFTLDGIDKSDRIKLRIESRNAGNYSAPGGNYTANGTQEVAFDVTVSLQSVTDKASLVAAINAALDNGSGAKDYFAAGVASTGELVIYHKTYGSSIKVSAVTALQGDTVSAGTPAYTATTVAGVAAIPASATTGSDFAGVTLQNGASLKFDLTVNGSATTVSITKATVDAALANQTGYTAGTGTISSAAQLALVAQRALSDQNIAGITVSASGSRLKFTKTASPVNGDSVNVSNAQAVASSATNATLTTGSDFTGPRTIAANASLDFTLTVDGTAKAVSITKTDVENALAGRAGHTTGSGTITDVTEFALVVQSALTRQNVTGITVAADGNRVKFTKTAAGSGNLSLSNVASASTATNAVATTGSDFTSPITIADDAALAFDITVDGGATKTVRIGKATVEAALAGVSGRTAGTGRIESAAEFATVLQRALSDNAVSGITVGTAGSRVTFTRAAAGAGSVSVGNVQTFASTATGAALTTGSDFAGPVTIDPGASIRFELSLDGGASKRVTIQKSTVETALAAVAGRTAGSGTIANVSEFALVVQQALAEANVSGLTVAASGSRIKLSKTATGTGQVVISGVASVAASSTTPSSTTIDSINVNSTGFRSLNAAQQETLLDDYIRNIELVAKRVQQAASYLTFVGAQLDIQSKHTDRLQGIEASRVGGLVNANLTTESVRRTALESRLALARKSIEIINQSRKNVLDIF